MSGQAGVGAPRDDLQHILRQAAGSFEGLRGARLFVTGGTGFFGRWLLESFACANRELQLGAQMTVLSRKPDAFRSSAPHLGEKAGIRFVTGDVRQFDAADVRAALGSHAAAGYDFVIHAATEASAKLNAENPLLMAETIVQGTRAALEFAIETGARRFLLTSSGAVYGRQPGEITHVTEEYCGAPDPSEPGSAYGEAKRMAELLCACFHKQHSLEPIVARCFAFVGPFLPLDAHFAIGNFIRDVLRGHTITVSGDGTPFRSYLYAADLAIWLWTMLLKGQPCRPYNVGSEDGRSITAIAAAVAEQAPGARIEILQRAAPNQAPQRYVPSTRRARDELGVTESIELPAAIARTIAYARSALAHP